MEAEISPACKRVYTKNARILPPGAEMACGREHIEVFWQQAASSMGAKSVKLHTIDFELKGDAIFEIGQAEIVTAGGSSQARYVVIWKQENGFWKWHVDIWNSAS